MTKPFDGSVDDVIDMAVVEMGTRLRDSAENVPSHVLIKFVAEANRAAERRQGEEHEVGESRSLLDQVDALPKAHAMMLLKREIARLEAEIATYKLKLEE